MLSTWPIHIFVYGIYRHSVYWWLWGWTCHFSNKHFWISTGQLCASFLIITRGSSWHLYVLTVISVMPLIVQTKYQWYCKELVHLTCFFCKNTNKLRWNLLITIRLIRCLRRYIFSDAFMSGLLYPHRAAHFWYGACHIEEVLAFLWERFS